MSNPTNKTVLHSAINMHEGIPPLLTATIWPIHITRNRLVAARLTLSL